VSQVSKPFAPVWLALWVMAFALSWLFPNHHPPWPNFLSDAWAALILLFAFVAVLVRSTGPVSWGLLPLVTLALVAVPLLQHYFGLIPFAGEAWMASTYLLGLLLALHLGERWETACQGQAMDAMAMALALAGVLSVAIQLIQWLEIGTGWLGEEGAIGWRVWVMDLASTRPYANVAQPNLLGTLLLWSVLAVAWAVHRRMIGAATGVLVATYLLFGVALAQSRTAWLGVATLVVASWYWARLWGSRWVPVGVTLLGIVFAIFTVLLLFGVDLTSPGGGNWTMDSSRVEAGLRPAVWRLFLDAAWARPWFGYGWNQVMVAQLAMAELHPPISNIFYHAHNLFLDLVLWCGIPIGLLVSALLVFWSYDKVRQTRSPNEAIPLLFLAVVGIHAMLELPLHYAYLLLPAGVFAGVLNAAAGSGVGFRTGRAPLVVLALAAATLLGVIVRDYMGRIEPNFLAMRFESARIGKLPKADAPDVIALTHLREWMRLVRFDAHAGMSESEIQWVIDVVERNPAPANLYKLAWTLAANDRPAEASKWLLKMQHVILPAQWRTVRRLWLEGAKTDPKMAAVGLLP
jgi:O-antigen ligase